MNGPSQGRSRPSDIVKNQALTSVHLLRQLNYSIDLQLQRMPSHLYNCYGSGGWRRLLVIPLLSNPQERHTDWCHRSVQVSLEASDDHNCFCQNLSVGRWTEGATGSRSCDWYIHMLSDYTTSVELLWNPSLQVHFRFYNTYTACLRGNQIPLPRPTKPPSGSDILCLGKAMQVPQWRTNSAR